MRNFFQFQVKERRWNFNGKEVIHLEPEFVKVCIFECNVDLQLNNCNKNILNTRCVKCELNKLTSKARICLSIHVCIMCDAFPQQEKEEEKVQLFVT